MDYTHALVTGGAGFIGSHLGMALLDMGCHVTILDDLSTGRWENIASLEQNPRFRALVASADDAALVRDEVAKHDFVYHLASAVGVRLIMERPVATVQTIIRTTDVLLEACSRYRRPVLLTSTSEVYGKSKDVPFREDADVVMGPTSKRRWAYACAKALDEFMMLAHHHETSLPVWIARLFNTVGPRQASQYGMVLPNFVKQALRNEPLTVFGDGQQTRCFCSVHDVVRGLIDLPNCMPASGVVVNLGSQEEISIRDLAYRVIDLTNSNSTVTLVPYEEAYGAGFDDMARRVPDISRAKELIGWQPDYSLNDIIREIVDYEQGRALRMSV